MAAFDANCTICFEEYTESADVVVIKECKHIFHYACLNTWCQTQPNCPMDRTPIRANSLRRS